MSQTEMEKELKRLKAEVSLLKSKVSKIEKTNEPKEPWWEQIAGKFAMIPSMMKPCDWGVNIAYPSEKIMIRTPMKNDHS